MFSKFVFMLPCLLCHQLTRYHGTPGLGYERRGFERALEYFDSVAGCARFCRKLGGLFKGWGVVVMLDTYLFIYQIVMHLKLLTFKSHQKSAKIQLFVDFVAAFQKKSKL